MPPELLKHLRRGIHLPPTGWALAGMLAFYVLAGLIGRDPWKGEDAIHLGTAWHVLTYADWLSPDLAGRPFDEPPLYYWSAAVTGKLLGWLLPLHDAMRVASGLWTALALTGIYYAGRELYGQEAAAASPMLLAGAAGLLVHAHDAQPMLVALAAYGGALGALAACGRKPRMGGIFYGLSLAGCLLGTGFAPTLPLLLVAPVAILVHRPRRPALAATAIGLGIAAILTLPWPLLLAVAEPDRLRGWLTAEIAQFTAGDGVIAGLGGYLARLPWFAFPLLPIALWSLWLNRRNRYQPRFALPCALFVLTVVVLACAYRPKDIPTLLLLPPLALLAAPGALSLRRGAANAFDWFSMMTFTFFVALVWLAWSAMALGWPAKLAHRVTVLRPGFVGTVDPLAVALALVASLWWLWLIVTAPRSGYRSLTHWTMGFTVFWLLASVLLLPWFDYGKSYRPVAAAVARALPADHGCLAERDLSDTQRASLAYFTGIEPLAVSTPGGRDCDWLLVQGDSRRELAAPDGNWSRVWEGSRPGDRRERFRLYRRGTPP